MTQNTHKGSGRTAGSYHFSKVRLSDLLAKMKETDFVVISHKWGQFRGIEGLTRQSAKDLFAVAPVSSGDVSVAPAAPEVAVQVSVTDPE